MQREKIEKNEQHVSAVIEKYSPQKTLNIRNVSMEIETEENTYTLIRLNDRQYKELKRNAVPISEDFEYSRFICRADGIIFNSLPKMYVTLRTLFGESGVLYDEWKGSFWFPFLVSFKKDGERYDYLLSFENFRSYIEIRMAKMFPEDDETFDRDVFHDPFDDFPRSEMRYLLNYFIGYLSGCFKEMSKYYSTPFFQAVDSNGIVFGWKDGRFFERSFSGARSFNKAVQRMEEYMATVERVEELQEINPFYVGFVLRALASGETEEWILRWLPLSPEEFYKVRRFLEVRGLLPRPVEQT